MKNRNGRDERQTINIDCQALGEGWIVFEAGNPAPPFKDLPGFLHRTLVQWFRERPQLTIRAALPIMTGGCTAAIHVWFDGPLTGPPAPAEQAAARVAADGESPVP